MLRLLLALAGSGPGAGPRRIWQDADPDTLALLDYLAPAVAELPILLVVGSQTEPPPTPALDRICPPHRLRLARLSDRRDRPRWSTASAGFRPTVRDAIVQRAEGLPLVAAEL